MSRSIEPRDGDIAPELSHWFNFLPYCPLDQTGSDGHPAKGGFLPPIELPRRMWAGSDMQFHRPLCVGRDIRRVSTILDVTEKDGRSGKLAFVKVQHRVSDAGGDLLTERQDIVYREAVQAPTAPPPPNPAPASPAWSRKIKPSPVLLFRFSAMTFNSHRIHYDRPYAVETEFYPGLVVHGPLLATLLMYEFKERYPEADIEGYKFRAVRPVFDLAPFYVCGSIDPTGDTAQLHIADADNNLCMQASVSCRQPLA
ncbi:FAS1-like dehydratase domain-containing protein [Sphingomonas abietis]|uniref:MaoC family dehydratase N-terminal domain-containing protein n=1 Tax=Sphingomonas abietis TaxID=3012344 RepID=A0ABY7NKU8_9SPHN|nr:MaoC family dehydratase N-terminal domain-containing protein [Sphingomonas abietis]WBO21978.1 MaoC family dehydratase N-terminal domain-containing protein [Sphingomonas abietis]